MYIIRVNLHTVAVANSQKEAILKYNDLFHAYKYIGEVKEDYKRYYFALDILDSKYVVFIQDSTGEVLEATGPTY